MPTYLEYIESQLPHIRVVHRSYCPLDNYKTTQLDSLADKSDSFKKALDDIRKQNNRIIDRDHIFSLFQEDLVCGFWVAMLWGNLSIKNLTLAVNDEDSQKSKTNKSIQTRLESVRSALQQGNLEKAFTALCSTDKIKGVGISFLTKILYFMRNSYAPSPKPLIYDKWTKGIDAALIAEKIGAKTTNYTLEFGKRGGFSMPKIPHSTSEYEMYVMYLNRIQELSHKFKSESILPDQLEEYLFGTSQTEKRLWNQDNPRYVLQIDYLRPLCVFSTPKGGKTNVGQKHGRKQNKASKKSINQTSSKSDSQSRIKSLERNTTSITPIHFGEKVLDRTRPASCGYKLNKGGTDLYVFLGEDSRKAYCEVISYDGNYTDDVRRILANDGFDFITPRTDRNYFIRKYRLSEVNAARRMMEEFAEQLSHL